MKISKVVATELINKSRGRIFTATFLKKNGELRAMNCRVGVNKGVNGKGMNYNPSLKGLKPVFDMQSKQWRTINLESIVELSINKENYMVR
jgi:pyruvate/2-oxoglutarate/acetoin dehydrogenase E1 component